MLSLTEPGAATATGVGGSAVAAEEAADVAGATTTWFPSLEDHG